MLQEGYRRVSIANAETWYGQPDIPPLAAHDLRWYLGGIWQHKCRAAACIAAALAGAVLYLAFAPPVYEARVKLLIESQNPNVVDFADVLEPDAAKLDYYETQVGILRSRTLAHRTLDRLNLWSSPTFAADGPDLDATAARSSAVDTFLSRLSIAHRSADRLLDARFRASDPRLAADVANALAHVYIEHDLELRRRAAKGAAEFLNARIEQQRTQVENRELAVQRYREEHTDVAVPESKSIAAQQLVELSAAATRAKSERIEVEAMARQLDGIAGAPPSDVALPAALGNAVVDQLKIEIASLRREETRLLETYGPRHPAVVRVQAALRKAEEQLRGEITRIAGGVRTQLTAARSKESALVAAVQTQQRLVLSLDRKSIEHSVLEREATSARQMFEALLERARQTEISSELKITNIQIVDPAEVPLKPSWPQPAAVLLLALMIGLPIGVAVALYAGRPDEDPSLLSCYTEPAPAGPPLPAPGAPPPSLPRTSAAALPVPAPGDHEAADTTSRW